MTTKPTDITEQALPFLDSLWSELPEVDNVIEELPDGGFSVAQYLMLPVTGRAVNSGDLQRFAGFVNMLLREGFVTSRLTGVVDLPMASGPGGPSFWVRRNELKDGALSEVWHLADTNVVAFDHHFPLLCGRLEGGRVIGFKKQHSLSEGQQACATCQAHNEAGTSHHEPMPERHVVICYLLIPSKFGTREELNERFGHEFFVAEGSLPPHDWPQKTAWPSTVN